MITMRLAPLALATALVPVAACQPMAASQAELRAALVEVAGLGAGMGAQDDVIELTTSFTLGQGVQAAAEELRDFVASQVPCSTVTVQPGAVSIDFGERGDACVWRGRTYAGVVTVGIELAGQGARVTHTYEGFTGGRVTMDGTAVVDWSDAVRHIVTDMTFATSDDTIAVKSDRTQSFSRCAGVEAVCVAVEGERHWQSARGEWDMTIEGVEARSIDPVPQAGSYTVIDPEGREIVMRFARLDDDTIRVEVEGGRRPLVFEVTASGQVSGGQ
jgi:hypothetical protein